jgi:hypothetical protein
MTWTEVQEHALRNAEEMGKGIFAPRPPRRDDHYSCREVIDEIALILGDIARFYAEHPEAGGAALFPALTVARWRDETRPTDQSGVGVGHVAGLITPWLVERPDREDFADNLAAAQQAVTGSPIEQRLAAELRGLVQGHLDGTISDDEFERRLKKPRRTPRRRPPKPRTRDPRAIDLHAAESALRAMLDELDDDRLRREPRLVWETFKRFAAMPVAADAPERLAERDGDMLLFEWGTAPSRPSETHVDVFFVSLVRQFTILDADDDYDRMEQLQCLLSISPSPELRELERGAIWGEGDTEPWITEAEQSAGFAALRHPAISVEVDQSAV